MNSGRTVPTRIVNKNGVSTTVHKRVDNSSGAARKAIPAVASPAAPRTGMTLEELQKHGTHISMMIANELGRNRHRLSDRVKEKTLATLNPDALDRLDKVKITVVNIFSRTTDYCLANRNFMLLNNLSIFMTEASSNGDRMDSYVSGLMACKGTPKESCDYSTASESELESARALIFAARELPLKEYLYDFTTAKGESKFLRSVLLRELIDERPHDVERIVGLLKDRRLPVETEEDIMSISELLDDTIHPAVGNGAL